MDAFCPEQGDGTHRYEALKQERREGERRADDFRKKVESGEIVYNKESGQFEESKPSKLTWTNNASVSEKINDIINLGARSEDRTSGTGRYVGPKVQEQFIAKEMRNRLGADEESIQDLLSSMDDEARKNAYNGLMQNFYSTDAAPRELTGDCKIRVRKA